MSKSKKQNQVSKKFKFTKHLEIGSPDAETDNLLMQAFIKNDALDSLLNMDNQRSIIIGRTGSGKSALLKYIECTQEKVTRIEPEAMSLRYLCNSTILSYFNTLGVNLNFFYKVLWKHVFIVELLKLYFGEQINKRLNIFDSIGDKIKSKFGKSNPKKEQALQYLKNWSNDFWAKTEHRIKELENNIETKFTQEVGINIKELLKLGENSEDKESRRVLTEVKNKAEKIINESQADELYNVIQIMKDDLFNDEHKKLFIIIDDLDKEWIPSDVRYDMIGAMIEVIKEFQIFKGSKIIISLRDNLYQMIFSGNKHKGGQREKFKPLYVTLEWNNEELKEFLERRLEIISENNVTVKAAFDKMYRQGKSGFDYMLERTFYRPRDVISYVNHAIENSNNKSYFTLDIIHKAEISYSIDRLQAIEDEWGENYGELSQIYRFLNGKFNGFKLRNISEDEFAQIYLGEISEGMFKGELLAIVKKWKQDQIKFSSFFKEIVYILFLIGLIGIKKDSNHSVYFIYDKKISISLNDLDGDCKIYVHKAFYSALKINTKELEQDVY